MKTTTLQSFTQRVHRAALRAIEDQFEGAQRHLVAEVLRRFAASTPPEALAQPLGLLHLASGAWGPRWQELNESIGAAAVLYLCSLDAFDDVQDGDLEGKALESVGTPLAINCALALSFLATRCAHSAAAMDPRPERRAAYLEAFDRASLAAVVGQHGDLAGSAKDAEEVLALHASKTSAAALLLELGALASDCDDTSLECYRRAGGPLATALQIVDDLRDVFGKPESPDLRDARVTYPFACFLELASDAQRARFDELRRELPGSLPEIRCLFYDAGVVERCADTIDELRVTFHRELAATSNSSAPHRLLLQIFDALAETIYTPERVPETASWFAPSDPFSREVVAAQKGFIASLGAHAPTKVPALVPWHLPHFEYDPLRGMIFYPDVDGLPEEVLPFHADLHGTDEPGARELLLRQLPFIVAHEMFHFLRDQRGLLGEDHWHEEWIANRLAVAQSRRHAPHALASVLDTIRRVVDRRCDSEAVAAILARCQTTAGSVSGYAVDVGTAAVVHARMLLELASLPLELDAELDERLELHRADLAAAE